MGEETAKNGKVEEAQKSAVEADALLRKCDESRQKIKDAAGNTLDAYDAEINRCHEQLIEEGIGTNPELEDRLAKLLNSRNILARVHSQSKATSVE